MNKTIITPDQDCSERLPKLAGGKGTNLFRLREAGMAVPQFFVITDVCFKLFTDTFKSEFNELISRLDCSTPANIAYSAGELRRCIMSHVIPPMLRREIIEAKKRTMTDDCFTAVRSSAIGEDSKDFSYAGMLDTWLFQKTDDEICDAVVRCWASIYSDRAVAYRSMRNIPQTDVAMAVVVQRMIDGKISGVTFTVNPITAYEDEMMVTSVWGLGEGLVSGNLDADQFVVRKQPPYERIYESHIPVKSEQIIFNMVEKKGTLLEPLPSEKTAVASLSKAQLAQVCRECHRIEQAYAGVPQDIEWTIDADGNLSILQSRPITTIQNCRPSEREYTTLWDNSNIVESYSGVTTPLTFTFALRAYHMVYVQFCEVLGVPDSEIKASDFAFANMLGFLNGRVYYNLKNWYRLISVLPGYRYNSRFMEGMMGVKVSFEADVKQSKPTFFDKYLVEMPRLLWAGINLLRKFHGIDAEVSAFMKIYREMYDKYRNFDFDRAPAQQIVTIYNELECTVLRNWKAPIINDFMAMICYGVLKMLMENWNLDTDGSLKNDLLAGQGNVESTLPMKYLQKTARDIAESPELSKLFKENTAQALSQRFTAEAKPNESDHMQKLRKMIEIYLDDYGDRAMNELKLEEPSLRERPEFLFSMLKNYASCSLPKKESDCDDHEMNLRLNAERKVRTILGDQRILFGSIRKIDILMFVAEYAKKAMAVREYQRFARTKMYGLVRRMFLGIAQRFIERGILDSRDDIFYLTRDEVIAYVTGTAASCKLRELAAIRKAEFDEYRSMDDPPDRIETEGIVYASNLFKRGADTKDTVSDPDIIRGIGGCSGIIRGPVKVILSPHDEMSLNGEILVAARTDPGWVPLFASASALLIERGSMLSHSVIVARELGIPAVVGASGVTKRLKTGDIVELNGTTGIVKIISRSDS